MHTTIMRRAAIYARQSVEVPEGIRLQVERCRSLAESRGWTVVEIYEDDATSASKTRGAKTGWGRMLQRVRDGHLDVIVAVDLDRLLRGLSDLLALMDLQVSVTTVDGEVDLSTADGQFRATMLAAMARFEVVRKAERRARMDAARRAQGLPSAGRTSYGYRWLRAHERGADGVPWAVDEDQAAVVRRAFDLVLEGHTLTAVCAALDAAGTPPTSGRWNPQSLRRLLLTPFVAGLLPPPQPQPFRAETIDPDTCTPGAWETIVPVETWLRAREILLAPERRTNAGGTARKHLLSGLASCDACGAPVRTSVTRQGIPGYRCDTGRHFMRQAAGVNAYATLRSGQWVGTRYGTWYHVDFLKKGKK